MPPRVRWSKLLTEPFLLIKIKFLTFTLQNLKQKIRDIRVVFCGDGSQPESIVGDNVSILAL
jgi:hypothetical protein